MSVSKHFRLILLSLLVLMIVALSPPRLGPLQKAHGVTRTIFLVGYYTIGWNNTPANPTITITQGDTLVITTSSGDGSQHHFFVDVDKDTVNPMSPNCSVDKCASIIPPTATNTLTGFTAGTYTYYCEYHPAMQGTFIVQPPPPDFSISLNPSSLTASQGSSQASTITVTSLNGFSGTVTFSTPTAPSGILATLSTSSVSVTTTTPGTATLNVDVGTSSTGGYTVSFTGSSGGISHTVDISVMVVKPDFAITPDQSSLSIIIGSSGSDVITLSSQNGFAGNVNLTATVSPSGPTVTLSPVMVSVASGGSASSTLSVTTMSASAGTYTVNVTATGSSSLSHSTVLSLTLAPQSSPAPASGIPPYVLAISGVVIVAAVLVVAYAVLRKRPGK